MTPVHVIVTNSVEEEQQYASAFAGSVEVYRFASNLEALERLTSARSAIDLLVITGTQEQLFNMTGRQLVARLRAPAVRSSSILGSLSIVLVDSNPGDISPTDAVVAPTLDDAIAYIKFGTPVPGSPTGSLLSDIPGSSTVPSISDAPGSPTVPSLSNAPIQQHYGSAQPAAYSPENFVMSAAPIAASGGSSIDTSGLLDSVISSIWNAPMATRLQISEPLATNPAPVKEGAGPQLPPHAPVPTELPVTKRQMPRSTGSMRSGRTSGGLFAAKSVKAQGKGKKDYSAQRKHQQPDPAYGLLPVIDVEVPSRGVYKGPQYAQGNYANAHILQHAKQAAPLPIPQSAVQMHHHIPGMVAPVAETPQLTQQVQTLTYPAAQQPADPVMGWSSGGQPAMNSMQGDPQHVQQPHPERMLLPHDRQHGIVANAQYAGMPIHAQVGVPLQAGQLQMHPQQLPAPNQAGQQPVTCDLNAPPAPALSKREQRKQAKAARKAESSARKQRRGALSRVKGFVVENEPARPVPAMAGVMTTEQMMAQAGYPVQASPAQYPAQAMPTQQPAQQPQPQAFAQQSAPQPVAQPAQQGYPQQPAAYVAPQVQVAQQPQRHQSPAVHAPRPAQPAQPAHANSVLDMPGHLMDRADGEVVFG